MRPILLLISIVLPMTSAVALDESPPADIGQLFTERLKRSVPRASRSTVQVSIRSGPSVPNTSPVQYNENTNRLIIESEVAELLHQDLVSVEKGEEGQPRMVDAVWAIVLALNELSEATPAIQDFCSAQEDLDSEDCGRYIQELFDARVVLTLVEAFPRGLSFSRLDQLLDERQDFQAAEAATQSILHLLASPQMSTFLQESDFSGSADRTNIIQGLPNKVPMIRTLYLQGVRHMRPDSEHFSPRRAKETSETILEQFPFMKYDSATRTLAGIANFATYRANTLFSEQIGDINSSDSALCQGVQIASRHLPDEFHIPHDLTPLSSSLKSTPDLPKNLNAAWEHLDAARILSTNNSYALPNFVQVAIHIYQHPQSSETDKRRLDLQIDEIDAQTMSANQRPAAPFNRPTSPHLRLEKHLLSAHLNLYRAGQRCREHTHDESEIIRLLQQSSTSLSKAIAIQDSIATRIRRLTLDLIIFSFEGDHDKRVQTIDQLDQLSAQVENHPALLALSVIHNRASPSDQQSYGLIRLPKDVKEVRFQRVLASGSDLDHEVYVAIGRTPAGETNLNQGFILITAPSNEERRSERQKLSQTRWRLQRESKDMGRVRGPSLSRTINPTRRTICFSPPDQDGVLLRFGPCSRSR